MLARFGIVFWFVLLGCSSESSPISQSFPYQFVANKTESNGHENSMELYACSGDIDIPNLREFCLERKRQSSAPAFNYLVVFDDRNNAAFPKSPFTAEYGLEEDVMKHIRAIYVYNRMNGFSEFRYYSENMWASKAMTESL